MEEEGRRNLEDAVALLPTPVVNDMGEGKTPEVWDEWTSRMRAAHGNGNGHGRSLAIEALRLIPTPTTSDAKGPSPGHGGTTAETVRDLLPTPTSMGGHGATTPEAAKDWASRGVNLPERI